MVPEEALLPDVAAIRTDLEYMTARWHLLPEEALIELRAFKEDMQPQTVRFPHSSIEDAVEWAESMNEGGYNLYAVRNPIRSTCKGSASDGDILGAFFLWADCDDGDAASNVKRWGGPKYHAAIVTGRQPGPRVHTYWELAEPCFDLAAWRQCQEAIAAHFGSDRTVVNPSRIMRIGGTVSYPFRKKREKGYTREVVTVRTDYPDERPRVTLDQMQRAFGSSPHALQSAPHALQIDTGPRPLDRERARIQALSGQEWHNAVIRLVASYVAKGLSDDEIHGLTAPLTLPGYTPEQTAAEVQTAIDGARRKGWTPEQIRPSEEAVEKDASGIITGLKIQTSAEFLSDLRPAVYVVDGVLAKRRCLSLTGYAGHGKTTLALHLAIQVATGGTFADRECEKGSVLVLAGENPDNVKWQYAAACAAAGIGNNPDIYFLPGHFQLSGFLDDLIAKARDIPNLQLVIIDSLQAFFEGENDNGNVEMMDAARRFRALTEIESGPAVLVIAHPSGKRPDKGNIVPRGGSAFGNEMDGNLTVWAEPDGTQTFHHSEKFRGAPFEPLQFVMEEREFDHLKDHKGRPLRLKVSRMQMLIEQANAAQRSERRDRDAIAAIEANPKITQRALAETLGVSKSTADRVMQTLKDEKLIRRHAKKWVLTEGGKEFFNGE